MKRFFSLCLVMLLSLIPLCAHAEKATSEREAISQLTNEISLATG